MAEKGDKNDGKIACFWDDFEKVSLTPPRHVGSERLPKLGSGLKRVPSRTFEQEHRRNRESESSDICSTLRDGAPRHAGGGEFYAWLPDWFCRRGVFRRGWRALNSQLGAARRRVRRFLERLSRSGPPVTHRDSHAASPTPRNGAPPHAGGRHFTAYFSSRVCRVGVFRTG